ncbi:MAG: class I SAM-dependent methyltransferase [Solirubrobacteraceae bacterium]
MATFDYLFYERRLGVDTRGSLILPEHRGSKLWYQGSRWRLLSECLRDAALGDGEVFLDAGCGKGRMLIQAARMRSFERVIGFDFSPELVEAAQANLAKVAPRLRCESVDVFVADAETWPLPDDVTVILLYNPFTGNVMRAFLEAILASFDRRRRRLRVLYVAGTEYEMIEQMGRFAALAGRQYGFRGPEARLYEVTPPQSPNRT